MIMCDLYFYFGRMTDMNLFHFPHHEFLNVHMYKLDIKAPHVLQTKFMTEGK